jgi:hypothetical protein
MDNNFLFKKYSLTDFKVTILYYDNFAGIITF